MHPAPEAVARAKLVRYLVGEQEQLPVARLALESRHLGRRDELHSMLDETFEMLTWTQLGYHRKPCALLDVNGYFERLAAFLDHAVEQRFLTAAHRAMLIIEREPETVLDRLACAPLPDVSKWMD